LPPAGRYRHAGEPIGGKPERPGRACFFAKEFTDRSRAIAASSTFVMIRRWRSDVRWIDLLGFAAAAAVLTGFCMNSIRHLRLVALASNVLFILYGLFAHLYPITVLHFILLPINLQKLYRIKPEV
jgi:hypothetical protein